MSAESNDNARRSGASFRATLDFVMGTVYLVMAGFVMYTKHFGTMELSNGIVYGMSALLIVYGGFRIYLGIQKYKNR